MNERRKRIEEEEERGGIDQMNINMCIQVPTSIE